MVDGGISQHRRCNTKIGAAYRNATRRPHLCGSLEICAPTVTARARLRADTGWPYPHRENPTVHQLAGLYAGAILFVIGSFARKTDPPISDDFPELFFQVGNQFANTLCGGGIRCDLPGQLAISRYLHL